MPLQHLIGFAVNVSMFLLVLSVGLESTEREATHLFRHPPLLVRSLLALNGVMLVVALLLIALFRPAPAIELALVAVAVSPVPLVLPMKRDDKGGLPAHMIGLITAAGLAAIVIVPLGMSLLGSIVSLTSAARATDIAGIVLLTVVLPLAIGIALRRRAPAFAAQMARPLAFFATPLLFVALLPTLLVAWPAVWTMVGNGLLLAVVLFTLIGLVAGHLLGGPEPDDRTALAIAASSRHPGIAVALVGLSFPDFHAALAFVLCMMLVGTAAAIPYARWRAAGQLTLNLTSKP